MQYSCPIRATGAGIKSVKASQCVQQKEKRAKGCWAASSQVPTHQHAPHTPHPTARTQPLTGRGQLG